MNFYLSLISQDSQTTVRLSPFNLFYIEMFRKTASETSLSLKKKKTWVLETNLIGLLVRQSSQMVYWIQVWYYFYWHSRKSYDDSDDSTEIENLHLIRCEVVSPSQDCLSVLYPTWDWIRMAKRCVGSCVTVCIISDTNVVTTPKRRTITCLPVDSIWRISHLALEWR